MTVNLAFLLCQLLVSAGILCQLIFHVLKEGKTVLLGQIVFTSPKRHPWRFQQMDLSKSTPKLSMKDWIFSFSISLHAFFTLFAHLVRLVPLPKHNMVIFLLQIITRLTACMIESLSKLWIISMCTARPAIHENMVHNVWFYFCIPWSQMAKHIDTTICKRWCLCYPVHRKVCHLLFTWSA